MHNPDRFKVIYECENCGSEYDLINCQVARIPLPCDDCGRKTYFYASHLIHLSWHWDRIEVEEDAEYTSA